MHVLKDVSRKLLESDTVSGVHASPQMLVVAVLPHFINKGYEVLEMMHFFRTIIDTGCKI